MSKKNRTAKIQVKTPEQPKTPMLLWVILAAASLIKLIYLKTSQASPFYEPLLLDPAYYHQWAQRLIQGQWDHDVFYGLPLYPYFLALCYKLSDSSVLFVKFVQIVLGVATVFLAYKTGEKLRDRNAGLLAAFLTAVYGPLFFHEGIFIPEALGVPLYALSFYLVLCFVEGPTVPKALLLGAAAGFATLTKAGILLFMLVFLAAMALKTVRSKGKVAAVLLCALVYFGTLLPIPLHNYFRGHDKVFLTSHAGFNFYIGNNPKAEGVFAAPEGTGSNVDAQIQDSRQVAERALGRSLKASEVSKYWSDKAWSFIRENPGKFFKLCGRKLLLFFDAREVSDVDDYQFASRTNDFLKAPWLNFAVLCPLLFLGLVSMSQRPGHRAVLWAWIGTYLFGMISFFVNARYRLPLLPLFLPLAAIGALDFYACAKELNLAKMGLYSLAIAAGVYVSQLQLVSTDFTRDFVNAGDALLEKNDTEGAKEFYLQALKQNPDSAKANLAMGLTLTKEHREEEAKDYYLKSIEADPNNTQAYNNLGLWYDHTGDAETAEKYFLKAIELKPNSSQAHNNLGMMYGKRGDNEKALREFEVSLKLNPKSPRANSNLGLILYRAGRVDEARQLWQKALELDPNFAEARKALDALDRRGV